MSKFHPPSYRSSRDPASQRRCDVITPLSFIISIDNANFWTKVPKYTVDILEIWTLVLKIPIAVKYTVEKSAAVGP